MPHRPCSLLAVLCLILLPLAGVAASLPLIPRPARVDLHEGRFVLARVTPLRSAGDDAAARAAAQFLRDALQAVDGPRVQLGPGRSGPAIEFVSDPAAPAAAEAYTLDIDARRVRIAAREPAGLVHGAATLFQLLTRSAQVTDLPALHIEDAPRFAWRGLMLDSVRHMQSPDEIRALIDQLALAKLNVLHWHLSDDQGWRVEIKRHPELTRIGAWRTPPGAGRDGGPSRYGGYYTQEQIRALVAHAAARGITIVPEIDMPGHAQAAVAAYPELGVTGTRPAVSVDWGVNPWLFNVDEATFGFIEGVLDELMALFPSRYLHVGGDEAIKDQWQAAPAVQARMRELGLTSENALQGWFIGRLGRYLDAHGRKLIGWDEILEGDNLPAGATVMSWRGSDGAIKAALTGHDVVMAPAPTLYFDHVQSALDDEYSGRLGVETLRGTYAFEPVPGVLGAAQARHVLGVQANVWTEHLPSHEHVEHAVFPRLAALAEVAWSSAAARDWADFAARLPAQLARYRRAGVHVADGAFAVAIDTDRNLALATGRATVRLSNQSGIGTLRYTLDGSEPRADSPPYLAPLVLDLPARVRANAFAADGVALAAPRERRLDRQGLLSLPGSALPNCPGSDFRLRVQSTPDATSTQPVYAVNVFDTCQQLPPTRLDGVTAIRVEAARLERNYALAREQRLVVSRAHATPFGELEIHADRCDGTLLASLPLPDPANSPRRFQLTSALPALSGERSLCFLYTAPIDGPLYGIGRVDLVPGP